MTRKPPQLGRAILLDIGRRLRQHYDTRVAMPTPNPKLDMLALIADAALRKDPYLKGAKFNGRPL